MSRLTFDRPLGAGESATIYPGSLAVDFGLSRAEIGRMNDDSARKKVQERTATSFDAEAIWGLPEATRRFFATNGHEQDHLRRMLSTTYGFMGDSLRCRWLSLVGRLVAEADGRGTVSLFEGLSLPDAGESGFEAALGFTRQWSASGGHTASLLAGVADLLDALTDDVLPSRFASALWGLANGQFDQVRRLYRRCNMSQGVRSAHPVVLVAGGRSPVSARHLLELFAIGEHANGLLRSACSWHEVEQLIKGTWREYALALMVWEAAVGRFDPGDIYNHPRGDDDLIIDWYRLLPFELYVAADLALWPPYFPNEGLATDQRWDWTDIDPGHRFLKVVAAMASRKIRLTPIPATGKNERFAELQSDLCAVFGWPTPHELAIRWLGHLAGFCLGGVSAWPALDGPSTYRVENAARLLAARIERPADVVLNNLAFRQYQICDSPVWLFREGPDRRSAAAVGRQKSNVLVPLVLLEGGRHLFTRDRLLLSPLFEPNFRTLVVETLGVQLSAVAGWSPKLLARFLDETHREFRTRT